MLLDLDGTLYDQTALRRKMLVRLALHCLKGPDAWRDLRALACFRRVREELAKEEHPEPLREQHLRAAARCGLKPGRMERLVDDWIMQRPLPLLAACLRPEVREFFDLLKERGLGVAVVSDYPVDDKLAALGLSAQVSLCAAAPPGRPEAPPGGFSGGGPAFGMRARRMPGDRRPRRPGRRGGPAGGHGPPHFGQKGRCPRKRIRRFRRALPDAGGASRGGGTLMTPKALCLALAALALAFMPRPLSAGEACPKGMVEIPGGEFTMGDQKGPVDARPARKIRLSPYCLDQFEVTAGDYAAYLNGLGEKPGEPHWLRIMLIGDYPLREKDGRFAAREGRERRPMTYVSWQEARRYCQKRNADLPSEAQWETACRLGKDPKNSPDSWGTFERGENLHRFWKPRTDAVGSFGPDRLGLYDMAGNVAEMCMDHYSPNFYSRMPADNPVNLAPRLTEAKRRVTRGGSFSTTFEFATCFKRSFRNQKQGDSSNFTGFRCAAPQRQGSRPCGFQPRLKKTARFWPWPWPGRRWAGSARPTGRFSTKRSFRF